MWKKGRTFPLEIDEIFLKMWYDYSALAIRENVKMVSTGLAFSMHQGVGAS